jgi:hypothetical protein
MNKKLLIGLGVVGLGALALGAGGGSADGTKPAEKGLGPGTKIPGGPPPPALDAATKGKVTALGWDLLSEALGYVGPFPNDPNTTSNQIRRFQTQYNAVSRLAGSNLAGIKVPSNMGTVEVNAVNDTTIRDDTKAAINAALAVSGGPSYVEEQLKPYLLGESDIIMETDWRAMVRAACVKHDQWLCVEWIDAGSPVEGYSV